jgi:diguanylate cyclase (GGDEF)-like protein
MKKKPASKAPAKAAQASSMTNLLGQSKQVKMLVDESAEELSSVNTVLKKEAKSKNQLSGIEGALEMSEAIEGKVQDAADKLAVVNQDLQVEVEVRQQLEQQLQQVTQDEEDARHASFHDPLTGLPNRALFDNRLEHGLAQAKRHDWTLAVMFMDLDGFKQINDVHGHDVGDIVLKTIAERLKQSTREDDTVSRHGGDEFMYLLMEIRDVQDIVQVAEKILQAIQVPCQLDVGEISIKTSIGISIYPKNGNTALDLVNSADKAMYEAKRTGSGYAFAD